MDATLERLVRLPGLGGERPWKQFGERVMVSSSARRFLAWVGSSDMSGVPIMRVEFEDAGRWPQLRL